MALIKIERLAVRDHQGKLTGIVSMKDLANHLDPDTAHEILKDLTWNLHTREP
jgi:predicted transcriptional regulator